VEVMLGQQRLARDQGLRPCPKKMTASAQARNRLITAPVSHWTGGISELKPPWGQRLRSDPSSAVLTAPTPNPIGRLGAASRWGPHSAAGWPRQHRTTAAVGTAGCAEVVHRGVAAEGSPLISCCCAQNYGTTTR
jgi:hypothetical protein